MTTHINMAQVKFHCRRGMLELDAILQPFCEKYFADLDENAQQVFVRLLEQPDPVLLDWLMGREKPEDPEFAMIVNEVRRTL